MPSSITNQEIASKFIDKFMKKAIDELVFQLEAKYNYKLSDNTNLELVLLSIEFINRLTTTIISQRLLEPEDFLDANFDNSGNTRNIW